MSEDKTEQPTDKKIEDARKKGQVAVSKDLARLVSLVTVAEMAFATQPLWMEKIGALFELGYQRIGQPFLPAMGEMLTASLFLLLGVFAAFYVVCSLMAFVGHWGQFGVLVATEALEPKFDKLNPVNGIKQMFAMKKVFELLLTVFKSVLIGWICYLLVRDELPDIASLSGGEPKDIMIGFVTLLRTTFHVIITLCICLALIDFGIQKYFHTKELMTDMEEIKKEHKEMEGDPMIKGKRKQLAREWIMGGAAADTKKANAVVTNPTHFAIAMFYDAQQQPVPAVLAKGKDEIAQAMIQVARENGIPVIRHVWLARTLYATGQVNAVIPKSAYEATALVYAVVAQLVAMDEVGREVELERYGEPPESYRT